MPGASSPYGISIDRLPKLKDERGSPAGVLGDREPIDNVSAEVKLVELVMREMSDSFPD